MKRLSIIIILSFLFKLNFAQIVAVRQVVASTGKDTVLGATNWAYTVGEAVVYTSAVGNYLFTQGFHQPDGYSIKPLFPYINNLVIYPNPGRPNTQVSFYLKADKPTLTINIYDVQGKLYSSQTLESFAGQTWHSLNPQIMAAGYYEVKVYVGNEVYVGKYIVAN
jgi:Secretion system C-terminal sorting domain